ncbi:hypothetical protein BO78DRAFT_172133 [Aspergillus sclerotiicarbonarius CBS 121057]|uniref:Uncharacterized protein n=1 Tax=Aspergillus sclerotiicarbonarius (strain CBS 121057 / IBT 28362) TaxID=1448318 RepID=A0A319E2K5_ASPSB|nr:hypothetical protein BO78DRAFT_172133 [Aspergillus sclerotiicarbonarius CBS 121057]
MQSTKLLNILVVVVGLAGLTMTAPVSAANAEGINVSRVSSPDEVDLKAIGDNYKV